MAPRTKTPSELVAEAVRTERRSEVFYRMLSEVTSDDETKTALLGLADDEARHATALANLYAEMTGLSVTDESSGKAEGDPNIFDFAAATPRDALEFALKNELRAIDFYQSRADATEENQATAIFRLLADNEREHAAYLELQISRLEDELRP